MATLYIRNVPEEVREALAESAGSRGSSINKEAISALRRGLNLDWLERKELMDEIEAHAPRVPDDIDVAALIREDRDSR